MPHYFFRSLEQQTSLPFLQIIYETFQKHEGDIMKSCSLLHIRHLTHIEKRKNLDVRQKDILRLEQLFSPSLILHVTLAFYLVEKMPRIQKKLTRVLKAMNNSLLGKKNHVGEYYLSWMMDGEVNQASKEEKRVQIREAINALEYELVNRDEEGALYEEMNVAKGGLLTHQAIRCLEDMNGRTLPFMLSIMEQVYSGAKVCEIGVGTGILSLGALLSGASTVVGVEINPITCLLAKCVVEYFEEKNIIPKDSIIIHWADALSFGREGNTMFSYADYDVVISENIYTGMFYEKQVQMMNRVHMDHRVKGSEREYTVLPAGMDSYVQPVMLSESIQGRSHTAIDLQAKGILHTSLAEPLPYHSFDFTAQSDEKINRKVTFDIHESGCLDAILIYSCVTLTAHLSIERNENEFLNNDHIITLEKPISVKQGDKLQISLSYLAGSEVEDMMLRTTIL